MDDSTTSLIINYLPQSLSDEQFTQLFEAIGPMQSARVMRNKVSSPFRNRGRLTSYRGIHQFLNAFLRPLDIRSATALLITNDRKMPSKQSINSTGCSSSTSALKSPTVGGILCDVYACLSSDLNNDENISACR